MKTETATAHRFLHSLFDELRHELTDTEKVLQIVHSCRSHAPSFPEVCFCKGCLLPIVDKTATAFLASELDLSRDQIHKSLRCEGFSTLHSIYTPSVHQSGYSGYTWGTNYQTVSKSGKKSSPGSKGYRPCPDFGIIHRQHRRSLSILGEVKFTTKEVSIQCALKHIRNDLKYYMSLPNEPEKGWDYDFGFGVVYCAGDGPSPRKSFLCETHWDDYRFMVACFHH